MRRIFGPKRVEVTGELRRSLKISTPQPIFFG
jgi:hypothetical protein